MRSRNLDRFGAVIGLGMMVGTIVAFAVGAWLVATFVGPLLPSHIPDVLAKTVGFGILALITFSAGTLWAKR